MSPTSDARAADMTARYAAGETLASIGARYGVTRERVRQILAARGEVTAEHARAARRAQEHARLAEIRNRAIEYLRTRPALTREQAARQLAISEEDLVAALGDEAHRLLLRLPATEELEYSLEEVLESIVRAADHLGRASLSVGDYEAARQALGGMPSSVRIVQRFGTWNKACRRAGLDVNRGRSTYERRWTNEEMLQAIASYLATAERPSYADYDETARVEDWPSGQTVRNTFGSWNAAKASALTLMNANGRRPSP